MVLKKSISARITFYATAVLAVVGLAVVYSVYAPHQETLEKSAFQRLETATQQQQNLIFDSIARLREDVQFLAQTPPLSGIARARANGGIDPLDDDSEAVWRSRLQTIFLSFIRRRPDYAQIRLIDYSNGGFEIVRVDRAGANLLVRVGEEGLQRKGDADYTKGAAALPRDAVYLSEINLNREYDRVTLPWAPTIRAATPVYGEADEPFAVIVINYNLTGLFAALERNRPAGSGLYLTNTSGDYLVDTTSKSAFGFDLGRPRRLQEDLPDLTQFFGFDQSLERSFFDFERMSNDEIREYVIHLSKIRFDPADSSRFLALGLDSSYDSLMAESYAVGRRSAWQAALLIVAGSVVVFFFMRRSLRPLQLIAESTDRVASGEYSVELPPQSEDEVGRLSHSFGRMISQVRERTEQIQQQKSALETTNSRLEAARQDVEAKAVELEQVSQYKSEFLARMAHDLRTPLNSMLILANSFAENRDGNLTAEQQEAAKVLASGGVDLLALINDLLDLSKVEAGKLEILKEPASIPALTERIRGQFQPLAQDKDIDLAIDLDRSLPDVIKTDPRRLRQILWNLLSNALKFTECGSVTLSTSRSPDGDSIVFAVSDTGPGIPVDQLDQLFSPYQRLERDVRSGQGGTGLGLAIVKELAAAVGGQLEVNSRVGEGSRFEIRLPLEAVAVGPTRSSQPTAKRVPARGPTARRILLADDNGATRWAVARTLQRAHPDAAIDEAETGRQALEAIQEREYECVVLDYHLPEMSGMEVLRSLAADPPPFMPRVFLYTGRDLSDEERDEVKRLSAIIVPKDGELEGIVGATTASIEQNNSASLAGSRLLLVEDNPASLFALSRELHHLGAEVEKATNGREALEVLGDRKDVDAVLMDMRMPVMDGYESIRRIRSNEFHRGLPIVSLTADAAPEDRDKCMAVGASAFLPKPVDIQALTDLLAVAMAHKDT